MRGARREIIRYKLIPRAVAYYTGEAAEDEEDDEDGDEYDDEDDDDEARPASGACHLVIDDAAGRDIA